MIELLTANIKSIKQNLLLCILVALCFWEMDRRLVKIEQRIADGIEIVKVPEIQTNVP